MRLPRLPLADLMAAHGLPRPECEVRFAPPRRWRWDASWGRQMVALEVQGGTWAAGRHTRGKGYANDVAKLNEGQLLGWLVVWATTDDLKSGRAAEWVRRALAARGG